MEKSAEDLIQTEIDKVRDEYKATIPNIIPMMEELRLTRTSWLSTLKKGDVVCAMMGGKIPKLETILYKDELGIVTEDKRVFLTQNGFEVNRAMGWDGVEYSPAYIQSYTPPAGNVKENTASKYVMGVGANEGKLII